MKRNLASALIAGAAALVATVSLRDTVAPAAADSGASVQQLQPSLPSTPARDNAFLSALSRAGLRVVDAPTAIDGAHDTCDYLAAGHVALEAALQGQRNNPTFTREQQIAYLNAAISTYCPRQTGLYPLA